jgi:serine/threonine protein phosphatase PrpC
MESGAPVGNGSDPRRRFAFVTAARSHTGLVREHNEDFVYAGHNLMAVADGVGGNVFGEIASELVVAAIAYLDGRTDLVDPDHDVRAAAEYANSRLAAAIQENPELLGMATTLTALRLDGDSVIVLNVGDSRAYRLHDGVCRAITRDDSLVQELLDSGEITDDEALHHPLRSVVLQSLSGGPFNPTIDNLDALVGDRYLVCSDGLPAAVSEDAIAAVLRDEPSVQVCATRLVELALAGGAPDNVTVAVADVAAEEPAPADDDPAVGVVPVPIAADGRAVPAN